MASIRRHPKSGRWQVRYRDPAGEQRSRNFGRKVDAERFAATTEADKVRGEWIDPSRGKTTVAELAERWEATRRDRARSTRDRDHSYLRSMILPTFGRRQVATIRTSEIERWLGSMDRAPATKAKALQILAAVFEMARGDDAIKFNPCDPIGRPRQSSQRIGNALSDEQVAAVIEAAEEIDPRNAAMVTVMARMGLRVGEAIALHRGDVDLEAGMLHVRRSMSRAEGLRPLKGRDEGDEGRSLPMPTVVAERLRAHLAATGGVVNIDRFLFTGPRGAVIRYTNWRSRKWSRIVEQVGFDVLPHDLRHTVTTRLFVEDRWTVPEV